MMLLGGLLALAPLSGCKLDDPEIPTEEIYLRNFIKEYGLIDPTQDFSSAVQTTVTLKIPSRASTVNVYAKAGDDYYRVGCFANLEGIVQLPVDVSEVTKNIMLDIDGVRYHTVPDGVVDVSSSSNVAPEPDIYAEIRNLWIDTEKWSTETKTNGESGETYTEGPRLPIIIDANGEMKGNIDGAGLCTLKDAEGNDMKYFDVTRTAHIAENFNKGSRRTRLGEHSNVSELGNTSVGSNVHFLIDNQDKTLSAYKFTFRTASVNDAKVRVVIIGEQKADADDPGLYVFMDSKDLIVKSSSSTSTNSDGNYTEWELRTDMMPKGKYELIIMGVEATPNPDGKDYCGNWGYMRIERLKTVKDMKWILACEDLGTTDDFDFNDVVLGIEAINTNQAAIDLGVIRWQVVENLPGDNGGTLLHKAPARADGDNNVNSKIRTQLKVEALAAGGTLPIWLHFREEDGKDYLVLPQYYNENNAKDNECLRLAAENAQPEMAAEESEGNECGEWHRWFGIDNSYTMLNTGVEKHRDGKSVMFYTQKPFSLENFCYLKFDTAEDADLPYLKAELDPWAQKVLKWKWMQENSQEVTYGFFLTVYKPNVDGSKNEINSKDESFAAHLVSKSLEGLPPQMIMIPDTNPLRRTGYMDYDGWMWPCERVNITTVYPNFSAWVGDGNDYMGINWFMMPSAGIVDVDKKLYPRDPERQKNFNTFILPGYNDPKDSSTSDKN